MLYSFLIALILRKEKKKSSFCGEVQSFQFVHQLIDGVESY